ncbi:MAG: type II toxin-antitoxin system VapC family toxin, partial [Bifidobacteriaceae bacterium]|nr:type II toxin-antitoxin system VapC family toxin [Bifidobacteriaceae bacterium]
FLVGQERGETPARKARRSDVLEVILSGGRVLDYTRETAAHHARLMTVASRQGRRRGAYDIMIAAHVVETGRILVTTDRKSALDDLPGVRLRVIDH